MRITKTMAASVAAQAMAFRQKEVDKAKDSITEYVDFMVEYNLPGVVKTCQKDHSEYLRLGKRIRFKTSDNADFTCWNASKNVAADENRFIKVSQAQIDELYKRYESHKRLDEILERDTESLEIALLQLSTVKKAKEALPELIPFFPSEISTALVPNFDKIRDILKK